MVGKTFNYKPLQTKKNKSYCLMKNGDIITGEQLIKCHQDDNNVIWQTVVINDCKNIYEWNNNVDGYFYASGSSLETINTDAIFGKYVGIQNCKITEWHNPVDGIFSASGSKLECLDATKIKGLVCISNTPLAKVTGLNIAETTEEKKIIENASKWLMQKNTRHYEFG